MSKVSANLEVSTKLKKKVAGHIYYAHDGGL